MKSDIVSHEGNFDDEMIYGSINVTKQADTLIIEGTSLVVYLVASWIYYFKGKTLFLLIGV